MRRVVGTGVTTMVTYTSMLKYVTMIMTSMILLRLGMLVFTLLSSFWKALSLTGPGFRWNGF